MAALAFIKDPNDRNNNMQYLECLSASLNDMGQTYQPAERMSIVLRAVMAELRGDSVPNHITDHKLYKPKAAVVPARRGSTNDTMDTPLYKKRQTSRPRAGTGASKKRSMSMASSVTNIDLTIKATPNPQNGSRCFDTESDRTEGYIMVTPQSEISSWNPLRDPQSSSLDHKGLSTPSSTALSTSGPRNAWMGAELDTLDSIDQLANVHFPEIPALSEGGNGDMSHLDFLSLGDTGDWGTEWGNGGNGNNGNAVGVGSDLDGFPPQGSYGMGFGSLVN